MATLRDVMAYLTKNYPHKSELSNARLTKLIYLGDWRAAITRGQQITDLQWEFNHYGPYLHDVIEEARRSEDFNIYIGQTMYGSPKQIVELADNAAPVRLQPWEEDVLRHVIEETRRLSWSEFIKLVYSTYPVVSQDRYTTLDLVGLALHYQTVQDSLTRK